ncbi:hypothetical protein WR25_27208 [Diploscapter pachys]|uniref:Uncharacterized protein n=1 Tax=Diploscapter pachys TaxID=2018661 RepID=A0A2A2JWM0_9BILA|nr:hypothetical protein WR25_27208 [Diploscapter pachys]
MSVLASAIGARSATKAVTSATKRASARKASACFAQRLLLPGLDAVGEIGRRALVRPGADDGLEQHVAVGARDVVIPGPGELVPCLDAGTPGVGHDAECGEAGAEVLAALVVVRRGGEHRVRHVVRAGGHQVMEGIDADAEDRRVEADVVAGEQAGGAVESGILDRFGGDRRGKLLEATDRVGRVAWPFTGEPREDRIDDMRLARRDEVGDAFAHRAADRGVAGGGGTAGAVSAIDGEDPQQSLDRAAQHRGRDGVIGVERDEGGDAGVELARKLPGQQVLPCGEFLAFEIEVAVAHVLPQLLERQRAERFVDQRRDLLHKVVAAGAVDAPADGLAFAGAEDLLDDDPGIGAKAVAQRAAIADRVGQAVDVIDADAVDQPFVIQADIERVRRLEHGGVFDADAGEVVDGEEAAPV